MGILRFESWCHNAVSGIRDRADRERVYKELYAHMEDQYEELIAQRMEDQKAEKAVVAAMGSYADTAAQLEKLYPPIWGRLLLAARLVLLLAFLMAVTTVPNYLRNLHDQLHELTQAAKESPDPVILSQGEVKNLLGASGVAPEQLEDFGTCYEEKTGSSCATFAAANIASESRYQVSTPDVEIRVSPDRSDLVEKKVIDGRPCLVIPITDEIHVNGIKVKI